MGSMRRSYSPPKRVTYEPLRTEATFARIKGVKSSSLSANGRYEGEHTGKKHIPTYKLAASMLACANFRHMGTDIDKNKGVPT